MPIFGIFEEVHDHQQLGLLMVAQSHKVTQLRLASANMLLMLYYTLMLRGEGGLAPGKA